MKTDRNLTLALLILGYFFSVVTINLNFSDMFDRIRIVNFFQTFDLATHVSGYKISTEIIGLLFYAWFGFNIMKSNPLNNHLKNLSYIFLGLVFIQIAFNFYSYILYFMGNYAGQHLRMVFPTFFLGLFIYVRLHYQQNNFVTTNNKQ